MSIAAMNAALEAPVAWKYRSKISGNETLTHQPPDRVIEPEQFHIQPLYTHPAPAELPPTDLNICPNCGGEADNGFDRGYPPNPYYCKKCMKEK